jgi:hypothetical protein
MAGLERIQEIQDYEREFQKQLQRASNFICFYWYGHDVYFKTDLVKKQFYEILNSIKTTQGWRINNIIANKPVIDVMYFIVTNDSYCKKSYFHRLYVLTVAHILFEEKRLYFSTTERKYTYMAKISEISRGAISEMECRNKAADRRDVIFNLTCCAVTCLLGYILV